MRLGLYTAEEFATYSILRDWCSTGIEFRLMKTGLGPAPYTILCTSPGVINYADLSARLDLLGINGAKAFVPDVGTWGSNWVVQNGVWIPDGPIRGNGAPENVITAPIGSMYLRANGGASTTLYVKESGTGNTGWIAK